MAETTTTLFSNQVARNYTRETNPSLADVGAVQRNIHIEHTIVAADATATGIKLVYPRLRGRFRPELSRVTNIGAGDVDVDFVLKKVSKDGTATALSGTTSVDNDSVAFARLTTATPTIDENDYLRLDQTITALTAADELHLDLVFDCADVP